MPRPGKPYSNRINLDSVLLALALILFGTVLTIWPKTSTQMIFTILGAVLCLFGAFRLLSYFLRESYDAMLRQDMTIGLVAVLLGILLMVKHEAFSTLLPTIFGCVLLVGGIGKLQSTIDFKRMGIRVWYIPLIAAVLCIVLGIVIMKKPMESMEVFTRLTGISVALEGLANLGTILAVYYFRRINQQ